jgi:DNA mismatch repair protein MutS2
MNEHALGILELPRALSLVAERAGSSAGRERIEGTSPSSDHAWIERELRRVAAVRAIVRSEAGWPLEPIPELRAPLARLRVAGSAWSAEDLLGGGILLRSSRVVRAALSDSRRPAVATAVLRDLTDALVSEPDVERSIDRAISEEGLVRDEASPALRRIRRELAGSHGELVRLLERIASKLEPHLQVPDSSVTVRNGRYVIPVRSGGRSAIGGIVHDSSASGATVFVEPPAAVEAGNRIRELEAEERREVDRILRELTEAVRPFHSQLVAALDALVELDTLHARARFAEDFRCTPAELADPTLGFKVRDGRHPLLIAQGIPVVPFDLEMLPGERTLLVSGPNTGGKTVLLKALGLLSMLTQCGIPAPVGAESRIPVYDDVFADVGDEQSIQASLSTFSAHLANLREILTAATAESLVLVDELGSGTDPLEGAALGGAILEELTRRGTMTVATTHLGALRQLATEVDGVINASLQFDAAALAPTYRLLKGVPGRSYGLSIARRLGFPGGVLERAEQRVPTGERDVAALLADLEKREAELSERERFAASDAESVRERAKRLAERERNVTARERAAEREARREARKYLLEARAEVERVVRELRESSAEAADEVARAGRRRVEELAAAQGEALERLDHVETRSQLLPRTRAREKEPLKVGDNVEVASLGGRLARIISIRGDDAVVALGSVKLTVPLESLHRSDRAPDQPAVQVALRGDMPEVHAPSEIDLRGMRVDEIESVVLMAIDAAARADLKSLRIIHGKGTGALRVRVGEMVARDSRVKAQRLGMWNEGGAGVTILELG